MVRPGVADKPGVTPVRSLGLPRSASEPNMGGSSSLKSAGAGMMETTNLYEKMKAEGTFEERFHQIRPAGVSITVPLADSTERDLQSEIYYPAPPTPVRERKFRKTSQAVGEIHVHHGLKEQKLPAEDFRYGIRSVQGVSTEQTMKAGQLLGVAEYKNSVKERVYESVKKEPLGKPFNRGHTLKMLPEGYGNKSGEPEDIKRVIFPVDTAGDEPEDVRVQYRRTHNNFDPGERVARCYNWPEEAKGKWFRFGVAAAKGKEGDGMRMALNNTVEDDGHYKRTRLVQRVCEDYRNVEHPKCEKKRHAKQGAGGPPVPIGHAFGKVSAQSDCSAQSCIRGYYSLKEQLPDQDLGRSVKPGRRNVTKEIRAFGIPSIRTDIPAPEPGKRSVANQQCYGDEFGAAALLNPQRFDKIGVPDNDFLLRRPKEELREIIAAGGSQLNEINFDQVYDGAQALFEDEHDLVSLDAYLYIYSQMVDAHVKDQKAGAALKGSVSSPALVGMIPQL